MESKKEKKKESALNINDDFDFNFAKKIPGVLRWILVVPAGFVGLLMVQLAYGFIVNMLLKNVSDTSVITTIVNAIFGLAKFYIFTITMVAMAPVKTKNKFKAGVGLSVVPLAIACGVTYLFLLGGSETAAEYSYLTTNIAIQVAVVILATIGALIYIKKDTNKEKAAINEEDELNQYEDGSI